MGLRVNTNVGALSALRTLSLSSLQEVKTFERLSTGLRINRASDDPSGLVVLQRLRSEITAIGQAIDNTQNGQNLVTTADAALGQVADQLSGLRAYVIAGLNTATNGPLALGALQDSIDQGLGAIDRIGATTRFDGRNLLNGNLAFNLTGVSPELKRVDVLGGSFGGLLPQTVTVNVTTAATRAQATGTVAPVQAAASTVTIAGTEGSQQFHFASGATQSQVVEAINAVKQYTGIEAVATGEIRSIKYGSAAKVQIAVDAGTFSGVTPGLYNGTDIAGQVNGAAAAGRGNTLVVSSDQLSATIDVKPEETGGFQFTVQSGGAEFQIGPVGGGLDDIRIGIGAVTSSTLGQSSGLGALSSLRTGGANSLAVNPAGGTPILDAAIEQVSSLRSRLGATSSQLFEANLDTLNVQFENLSASASTIRDANMAEEISRSVRDVLARNVGLSVLQTVNLNAGLALRLLQG